jgi:putative tryptophan/tyrosine transport system substrate-binding protein
LRRIERWRRIAAVPIQPVISRRTFLATMAGGLIVAPLAAQAQPAGKTWRIGWLSPPPEATGAYELDALRKGLQELNYIEGQQLKIEARWADGDSARLPELARALVQLDVDVICTAGTPATLAAKQATTRIPIVFGRAAFPDRTGLITSLARPGGNLTGVAFIGPEYGKRLEVLREVAPKMSRVTLLYNDANTASMQAMKETQQWAQSLHLALEPLGVRDRPSLEAGFAAMRRHRPDAIMTTADPLLASYRTLIVDFANGQRFLSMYGDREYVTVGGLMFYGTSMTDMWRQAAIYVDRILKGAKPGDLPVEQPTKFELVINMKTVKALGLKIPRAVLQRADQIIE